MAVQTDRVPPSPVDSLAALLSAHSKTEHASPRDLLLLALSLVQLAQRTKLQDDTLLRVTAAVDSFAAAKLYKLDFPIMDTLLSHKYAAILEAHNIPEANKHKILLESLFTFLTIVEERPEGGTEPILREVVELTASQQPAPAHTPYPPINYRAALRQIFNPGKVAAVDLEPLSVIVYRGELLGGGFGPELWGLAYVKDETAHVLLETGEYVALPANSLTLAATKDYGTHELPAYLLACAKLFVPIMFEHIWSYNIPPELQKALQKLDKHFGSFTANLHVEFVPAATFAACENIIDSARWRVEDKQVGGAIKTVSVGKSCLQVTVSAQQSTVRPYAIAMLVQSDTHNVLLRLDTPREFTTKGVYLFPAGDNSAGLCVL